MKRGPGRDTNRVMAWSMLCATALVVAGLANGVSTASKAEGAIDAPNPATPEVQFNKGAFVPSSSASQRVILLDGTYFIGRTSKTEASHLQRQVSRYTAKRIPPTRPDDLYQMRFTATQTGGSSGDPKKPGPVIRPGKEDKFTLDSVYENGMMMPDEGMVIVNGTAPIIQVKKATVSSDGTKFAIEATSAGWLFVVLETSTDDVWVYFDDSTIPNPVRPRAFQVGQGWYYPADATLPNEGRAATTAEFTALRDYADWVLSQTP